MPRARRILRWLGIGAGAVVGAAAVLLALAYAWVQSDGGRVWLAGALGQALSVPGQAEVRIAALEGPLPQAVRLVGLTVADSEGSWLNAAAVDLTWRPLALLGGVLDIENLAVADLRLERLPASPSPAPAGRFEIPTLPFDIVARRLSVTDLHLGAPVLGVSASLRIAGEAATGRDSERFTASLTIERRDGVGGRVAVSSSFAPARDELELDVEIAEPEGGLLARWLDLPDLPAIDAKVSGAGPVSDWHGQIAARAEGLVTLEANLALARAATLRFGLQGTAIPERIPGGLPWALFAGEVAIALDGQWLDDRIVAIERATLESPAARVLVSGRLDLDAASLDLRAESALKDETVAGGVLTDLRLRGLAVDATARGTMLQPAIGARLALAELTAPGLRLQGLSAELAFRPEAPLDRTPIRGALSISGRLEDHRIDALADIAPLIGQGVTWQLDGTSNLTTLGFEELRYDVRAERARATGQGRFDLAAAVTETAWTLVLDDLSGAAPLVVPGLRGQAQITGELRASGPAPSVTAQLSGKLSELAVDAPVLAALLAGRADIAAGLSWDAGGLSVRDIALDTPAASLRGAMSSGPGGADLEARYRLDLPETAVLSNPLGVAIAGPVRIEGTATGALADPRLAGKLASKRLTIAAQALADLDLGYSAEDLLGEPRGRVTATAQTTLGAVAASGDYRVTAADLLLSALRIGANDSTVTGELGVPLDGRPLSGVLRGDGRSLAGWLAMVGLEGEGGATATLRLAPQAARQSAELTAAIDGLRLSMGADKRLMVSGLRIAARSADLFEAGSGEVSLTGEGLTSGPLFLDTLSLSGSGTLSSAQFQVAAKGKLAGPLAVEARGAVRSVDKGLDLDMAALDGELFGQPLRLNAPFAFIQRDTASALKGLDLVLGPAQMKADGELDAQRLRLALSVADLSATLLLPFLPDGETSGRIAAQLAIDGPRADPGGTAKLTLSELRVAALDTVPPLTVSLDATWRGGRLSAQGQASGFGDRDAAFSAELPLRLDPATLALDLPADAPLSGRATWAGDLGGIWPLVPLPGHQLSGRADIALTLGGTLQAPELSGRTEIADGSYEHLDTGALLRNLSVQLGFDAERVRITKLSADDGVRGRFSGTGELRIDPAKDFPYDLDASFQDFALVRRDDVAVVSDGRLAVAGDMRGATLAGTIESRSVNFRIPERMPPDIVDLQVTETGTGAPPATVAEPRPPFALAFDLAVSMPRRVFIRGRGMDSEWQGSFRITGDATAPIVAGEASLVRGQLSLLGKTFRMTRGSVTFPGGGSIDPLLDVVAEHAAKNLSVTARIAGPVSKPSITLGSVPELPRDEIVARVLFGRATSQLSAIEAAQLAASVAELTGRGPGGGVLEFTRKFLGVDVLRVGSSGNGANAAPDVSAGKYLTEDVFVGVKKGVGEQSGAVSVEVELTPNISLESETSQTGQSDIGIKFKWNY